MELMADPSIVLDDLQDLLNSGMDLSCYLVADEYYLFKSDWRPGKERYTFAKVKNLIPQAVSIFCYDPIKEMPIYNLSYAVSPKSRGLGLAFDISQLGLNILIQDLKKRNVPEFILEAVVGNSNTPSIKTAEKFFLKKGTPGIETESGAPILHFEKKILVNTR
jgi:hypothetical protein